MPSVVKASFRRARAPGGRGAILAHKYYVEWRPDEQKGRGEPDRSEDEQPAARKELEKEETGFRVESRVEKANRRGEPRPFFSAKEDRVSSLGIDRSIKNFKNGDIMHKIILSPGAEEVDTRAYVREVMACLGQQKGQDLQWVAVVHENTDHQHSHVMLWGQDQDGGQVTLRKNDLARLRAYGDRYLEREMGLEHAFNRSEEEFARSRGLNLAFKSDRDLFMEVLNVPDDKVLEANRKIEPIIATLEWRAFDDEWKKYQVDRTGVEPRAHLGKTILHDLGRQSDFTQLGDNKADKEFWENFGKDGADKKDIADDKLGDLKEGDQFLRELIGDKTKVIEPDKFLDGLADQMKKEADALQVMLSPAKQQEQGKEEIAADYSQIDELLGLDPNINSDAKSPLSETLEIQSAEDFFGALLGTSKEERDLGLGDSRTIFGASEELGAGISKVEPIADDKGSDSETSENLNSILVTKSWGATEAPEGDTGDRRDDEDNITFDPSGMY